MKILIYGDDNSFGNSWVNIIKEKSLKFDIINESLIGRTAGDIIKDDSYKNGKEHFITIIKSHEPIDILIISLGSNDLKNKYRRSSFEIFNDLRWYKDILNKINVVIPRIYYIVPVAFLIDNINYIESDLIKRDELRSYFNKEYLGYVVDPGKLPLMADGIYLDSDGQEKMADIIYKLLMEV